MEETQKKTEPTKGEWYPINFGGYWQISDGPFYEDLDLFDEENFDEAEYNAILAASAPDLLEACQWAYKTFKRLADEGRYPEFLFQQNGGNGLIPLVKAIRKATTKP